MEQEALSKEQAAYNKAVTQVYFKLLKAAKELLTTVEEEPLRYSLIRVDKHERTKQLILHEFISPLLYLRLELHPNNQMSIHYGYETLPIVSPYYSLTAMFVRLVYKLTMDDGALPNIEDAVRVDWVVNECSEAYEYLEEQGCKHHRFELIKHKPKVTKRKLRKVA